MMRLRYLYFVAAHFLPRLRFYGLQARASVQEWTIPQLNQTCEQKVEGSKFETRSCWVPN